jgi:hypothetical protein
VLKWLHPSETIYHNEHMSFLEKKQPKTVRLDDPWLGYSENDRMLLEYLRESYPVYFGLDPYAPDKSERLSNRMRYEPS